MSSLLLDSLSFREFTIHCSGLWSVHSSLDPVLRAGSLRPTQAAQCSRESASGSRNGVANLNPKLDSDDPTHTSRVLSSCSCYSPHQRTESPLNDCMQMNLSHTPTARFLSPKSDTVTVSRSPSTPAHTRTRIAVLYQISCISMTRGGGTGRGYSTW